MYFYLIKINNIKLIKENKEGKTITYSLTIEGKKESERAKMQFCRTFSDVF